MRLIFYIFLISQFLSLIVGFTGKLKGDPSEFNSVNWEKVEEKNSKIPNNNLILYQNLSQFLVILQSYFLWIKMHDDSH